MKLKATVYRLAFSTARAAVIGKNHEHPLHNDPQGRQPLSGLGGGGVGPTPLRCPRGGKQAGRQIAEARHAARVRRRRVS
jgi:hypothetical protein